MDRSLTSVCDVPLSNGATREPSEEEEHHETKCAGKNNCGEKFGAPQAGPIHVDLGTDSYNSALTEIEIADNSANDCETR